MISASRVAHGGLNRTASPRELALPCGGGRPDPARRPDKSATYFQLTERMSPESANAWCMAKAARKVCGEWLSPARAT